jgi:hypothetical protein
VLALDFLSVFLAHLMLLGIEMSLVGTPSIGVKLRDTKGLEQAFKLQENVVLTPSERV